MAIFYKYKDILNDLINSLDIKCLNWLETLNWLRQIDKETCNTPRSKSSLLNFLKKNC